MALTPKKHARFQDLKKKYGFDIAILKQNPDHKKISDEELFKSLLLFHLQKTLTDEINAYVEDVDFAPEELASLVTMLFNTSGEIIGQIARQNPAYLLLCKKIALNQFDSHIKDFINGKLPEPLS